MRHGEFWIVFGSAFVLVTAVVVGLATHVIDLKGTVQVRNDGDSSVTISCERSRVVSPDGAIALSVSVMYQYPCFVSQSGAHGKYLGCIVPDFSFGREVQLSSEMRHLSLDKCWAEFASR